MHAGIIEPPGMAHRQGIQARLQAGPPNRGSMQGFQSKARPPGKAPWQRPPNKASRQGLQATSIAIHVRINIYINVNIIIITTINYKLYWHDKTSLYRYEYFIEYYIRIAMTSVSVLKVICNVRLILKLIQQCLQAKPPDRASW